MGLINEVAEMKREYKNALQEQEKAKKQLQKLQEEKERKKEKEKNIKEYENDLKIAVKNDLKQEFEKQYKIQGLNAKYYFYNVENRESTIKNIIVNIEDNQAILYDYLDIIYDKTLNEIDKKYLKHEQFKQFREEEKERKYIEEHREEIQKEIEKQEKEKQKEKSKIILLKILYTFLNILLSPIGLLLILFILFWWGYFAFALPIINS